MSILKLLDRKSEISVREDNGERPSECSGVIEFKDVDFVYPTRTNVPVLQGEVLLIFFIEVFRLPHLLRLHFPELSLEAQPGQTVALVGESGCGKSTLIQLVLRFYDAVGGEVSFDGHPSQKLSVNWLRAQIGLVSQEPVLFDYSIRENIAYGDSTREIPMSDIIQVAREANIHDFIVSLPEVIFDLFSKMGNAITQYR